MDAGFVTTNGKWQIKFNKETDNNNNNKKQVHHSRWQSFQLRLNSSVEIVTAEF